MVFFPLRLTAYGNQPFCVGPLLSPHCPVFLCKFMCLHSFKYYLKADNSEISVFNPAPVTEQSSNLCLLGIFTWMAQTESISFPLDLFHLYSLAQ